MSQTHTAVSQNSLSWLPASRAMHYFLAVLAGSILLALSAHVSVPFFFTPVPFTLQPLAVLLLGLMLEPSVACATLIAYLAEGASGLPVFAPGGPGGFLALMGPSAGFLWAYPFAVVLVSKLYRRLQPSSFTFAVLSAAAGSVVYFTGGACWFSVILHQPMSIALKMTVWPFLAGDALKVIFAAAFITGLSRFRSRRSTQSAV